MTLTCDPISTVEAAEVPRGDTQPVIDWLATVDPQAAALLRSGVGVLTLQNGTPYAEWPDLIVSARGTTLRHDREQFEHLFQVPVRLFD